MNENLELLFEKILNDSEFVKNMCEYTQLGELYEYCSTYVGGYSIDEFKEFLETIILLNSKISGRYMKLSDESLKNLAGGVRFSAHGNKAVASLILGMLLTNYGISASTNIGREPEKTSVATSLTQVVDDKKENFEINEKLINSLSEGAKQAISAVSNVAEKCVGAVFDVISPKVSAAPDGESVSKKKPKINNWPTASSVMVGQKVGDSKLSGGSATVSGHFSWLSNIVDEELINDGKATYICQFIPDDQEHYTKVTNNVSFEVKSRPDLSVNWPTAEDIVYGQSVRDSKLKGGSANIDGHFEWDSSISNSHPSAGIKSFKVVFKPKDSKNYKEISCNINVRVNKATPKIKTKPSASPIVYGQPLNVANLSGFNIEGGVRGTWKWVGGDDILSPGTHSRKVVFEPNDTNNYNNLEISISVKVNKSVPILNSVPYASSIAYGQSLSYSNISGVYPNVSGYVKWDNPDFKPDAGNYQAKAVFIPYDTSKYEKLSFSINVYVAKAEPKLTQKQFQRVYSSNLYLKDFSLPDGWSWKEPHKKIDKTGRLNFTVVYTEDKNYTQKEETVTIDIEKMIPNTPTVSGRVYDKNIQLKDISLPYGWHWENPHETPCASKSNYMAYYTETEFYKSVKNIKIRIDVSKATPSIKSKPNAKQITYGQKLENSEISDFCANIEGSIKWKNPDTVLPAGNHTQNAVFVPHDSSNYSNLEIPVTVSVSKATPVLTQKSYDSEYKPNLHLRDFSLPSGWEWETPDFAIDDLGKFDFKAVHSENDNYNKNIENVSINISKAAPTLSLPDITYDENVKLGDIKLPKGWHFVNPDETPVVSKSTYLLRFDADEAGTRFYNSQSDVATSMNVKKATSKIEKLPVTENQLIFEEIPGQIKLVNGVTNIPGEFKLLDDISSLDVGEHVCKVQFIPKNENYESLTENITINIEKNMTPKSAPSLTVDSVSRSDTSIKISFKNIDLKQDNSIEYSIDGGKIWQNSSEFKNLSPNTQYDFVYRYKETKNRCASNPSNAVKIITKDVCSDVPEKPKVKKYTNHEIMFEENNSLEFSKDGGETWQDSPTFSGLESSTKYSIIARFKETENQMASAPSIAVEIKTRNWLTNFFHKLFG